MAVPVEYRSFNRLTVDDVMRMVDDGLLEDVPVELLMGVLQDKEVKSPEHVEAILVLLRWLAPVTAAGAFDVRPEAPVLVSDRHFLSEPDLAVVPRSETPRHPTEVLLIVEMCFNSNLRETTLKPLLYASAGFSEYWIVDLPKRRLEVHRTPRSGEYQRRDLYGPQDTVSPLAVDVAPLELGELLRP